MKHDHKIWDRYAAGYFKRPIANPEVYEEKLRMTREHLKPDMDVLEFGCGTGGTAIRHSPHVHHIQAVDISEAMLDIGRQQVEEDGIKNVWFERADIAEYEASPESYDAVLGLSILHLLEDPAETIASVYRWLKPGGMFVSSTACLGDKMGWFRYVAPVGRALGRIPYVNVFKADYLVDELAAAGFLIETHWQPEGSMGVFVIARKPAALDQA